MDVTANELILIRKHSAPEDGPFFSLFIAPDKLLLFQIKKGQILFVSADQVFSDDDGVVAALRGKIFLCLENLFPGFRIDTK